MKPKAPTRRAGSPRRRVPPIVYVGTRSNPWTALGWMILGGIFLLIACAFLVFLGLLGASLS